LNDLVFLIVWYDDYGIFRTLDSLPKEAKKIVVDGKFKDLDGPQLSKKEWRVKVRNYPNVIFTDAPDLTECDKRNVSLKLADGYRYAIVIDSDEYVKTSNWNKFFDVMKDEPSGFKHVLMQVDYEHMRKDLVPAPRVIINPGEWMYYKAHCLFKNKITQEVAHNTTQAHIFLDEDVIILNHDQKQRSFERELLSNIHEKKVICHEEDVRQMYSRGHLR